MRILIAEDEPVSRLLLQKAVERLGHECLVTEDGTAAWERFQETPVDAIVSDWMMPGLDGLALCRRVRERESATYTYVVLLTTLSDKAHLRAGLEAGADDYLTKPLDLDELEVRLIAAARVTSLYRQLAERNAEVERLNRELFEQARRDPLTQLRNRLQLQEDLALLDARAARYGQRYCVALCDVDCFKPYNDHYGHPAGDEVLRAVADVIAQHCRCDDLAYRYGGEEFLLLLPEQSPDGAVAAVERLRRAVEGLAIAHDNQAPPGVVTISAGVAALLPGEAKTADDLLREADAALYRAKEQGRNQVALYAAATVV